MTSDFNALWQMNSGLFFLVVICRQNAFPSPFDSAPYEALSPNRKYLMWRYCFEEKKTSSFHLRLLFLIFFQKRWAAYIEQTQFLH